MTETIHANGRTVRPRMVFDRFLNRVQIRLMTDGEFFDLFTEYVEWFNKESGQTADTLVMSYLIAFPFYGSKAWAGNA